MLLARRATTPTELSHALRIDQVALSVQRLEAGPRHLVQHRSVDDAKALRRQARAAPRLLIRTWLATPALRRFCRCTA